MFGQSQGSGGSIFGSNPASGTAPGAGAFGAGGATPNSLFGSNSTANTSFGSKPGSGLFGASTAQQPAAGTKPGIFGGQTASQTGQTGLFGNTAASGATGGTGASGIFGTASGASGTGATSTGGLFGTASGANGATSTTGASGLFGTASGVNGATSAPAGGIFGTASGANGTGAPAGGLFGTASGASGTGAPAGGLFGTASGANGTGAPAGGLFGTASGAPASGTAPQPMFASINRAAYELPDVAPSVKLYTSLTSRPADLKQPSHKQEKQPPPPPPTRKHRLEPEQPKQEARKLMNSYKRFLEERPTNLQIKRSKILVNPTRTLALPPAPEPEQDFSIFHKTQKNVQTLTINKKALEQGYFTLPSLEDLLVYTPAQLKAVKGLIIGRTGYGQVEYATEVDLSSISNLGDILGSLVQFNPGTVSVYPDESKKAPEGTELNKPAVVTIENVAPREPDGSLITDPSDPRVAKFSAELRKRCAAKGAEFITLTKGIWVFKVPHFSVWGITPQEMVMEDDTPERILDEMEVEPREPREPSTAVAAPAHSIVISMDSSPDFTSAIEPEIKDQVLPLTLPPRNESPMEMDIDQPTTWAGFMKDNVLLGASSTAVTEVSLRAARNAVFAGTPPTAKKPEASPLAAQPSRPQFSEADLLMSLEDLKSRTSVSPRKVQGLARLSTQLEFGDLEEIKSANPAWSIAAMLFEPSQQAKHSLGLWIKRTTTAAGGPALAGMDLVWHYLTLHMLEEAALQATKLGNVRLASIIACMAERRPQNQSNARHQLDSYAASGAIYAISEPERRILEVAAGNLGESPALTDGKRSLPRLEILQGLDWRRRIGMYLWYGSYAPTTSVGDLVKRAVKGTLQDNTELAMLKLVGDSSNLRALLALVDEPTAFLLLQALQSGSEQSQQGHRELADELYRSFSAALSADGRPSWALFVALHIEKDEVAMELTRQLLNKYPTYAFDESYLPAQLVNEVAAQYAYDQGDYREAAQKWLRAGRSERAHGVLVEQVAPAAVIAEDLGSVALLLDQVDPSVAGWATGGKVYRDFYTYLVSPSAGLARSLSQSIGQVAAGTLATRAALSVMAGCVARDAGLGPASIMGMPLGADAVSVHACLCAYRDLARV